MATHTSRLTSCFTKGYGKTLRDSGALLLGTGLDVPCRQLSTPKARDTTDGEEAAGVVEESTMGPSVSPRYRLYTGEERLRFFTPAEVARLLGFGARMVVPEGVSVKQQWALLVSTFC